MNLLDLDNDCLNIIGNMVKKDNKERAENRIGNTRIIGRVFLCLMRRIDFREYIENETLNDTKDMIDFMISWVKNNPEEYSYSNFMMNIDFGEDGYDNIEINQKYLNKY